MHLDEYLRAKPHGAAKDLCEAAGMTGAAVSRLRRDKFWPSRETWQRISAATNGRVTPNDHLNGPESANGESKDAGSDQQR